MNPLALVDSLFMLLLIGGVSVLVLGFLTALYAKLMLGWLAQIDVDFRDSFMAMLIAWFWYFIVFVGLGFVIFRAGMTSWLLQWSPYVCGGFAQVLVLRNRFDTGWRVNSFIIVAMHIALAVVAFLIGLVFALVLS